MILTIKPVNKAPQLGQAMVEFIIIFPVLVLLTFGTFQLALVYNAKTALNYAAFAAARNGAVENASRDVIEKALFRGLAPLFTSINGDLSDVEEVQIGRDLAKNEFDNGFICVERINPTDNAFLDFAVNPDGTIPNDNLMYRSAKLGATSLLSIQDVNLLKLRVTYCHRLIVPFFSNMIQLMASGNDPDGIRINKNNNLYHQFCYANGRMPIVSQAMVRMQSNIQNDVFSDCTSAPP